MQTIVPFTEALTEWIKTISRYIQYVDMAVLRRVKRKTKLTLQNTTSKHEHFYVNTRERCALAAAHPNRFHITKSAGTVLRVPVR